MRKWINAVLVAALCLALCVGLAACSADNSTASTSASASSGSEDAITDADVEGKWSVVAIQDGYETLTGTTLEAIGQDTTFGFDADGSCYADTAGTVVDGTWKLSGDQITMTFDNATLTGTVSINEIVVDDGAMTMQRAEQQN